MSFSNRLCLFADHLKQCFCENQGSKLSLCLKICLQGNHKVSVCTSSLTICLFFTLKNIKLYTLFLHFDNILTKIFRGFGPKPPTEELTVLTDTPSCWKNSQHFCGSLLKKITQTLCSLNCDDGNWISWKTNSEMC